MTGKTVEMIALTTIQTSSGRLFATGRTDAEGNPVFEHERKVISRGSRFSVTREEADQLLQMDAAEEVEQ